MRSRAWAVSGFAAWIAVAGCGTRKAPGAAEKGMTTASGAADRAASAAAPPAAMPTGCAAEPPIVPRPPPIADFNEVVRLVREEPAKLGSASLGSPTNGRLWGGVELAGGDGITLAGGYPWGTELVVRSIERAVREVRRCHADTPDLSVGDISRKEGGWLSPHRSHQSGLDADIGYYYVTGPGWFKHADATNLDRPRTWALVRAIVEGGHVDSIFMDRAVQDLLREHAATIEADAAFVTQVFGDAPGTGLAHHASGHDTHFHVRFSDPESVVLGARLAHLVSFHPEPTKAAAKGPSHKPPPAAGKRKPPTSHR